MNRLVRHDAAVSVARSCVRRDWERLLADAGVAGPPTTVSWRFLSVRCRPDQGAMTASADVLVIGGGPAGATAAARLAAAGLRVVLCERQAEPRPQVCGEYVSAAAAAELEQLGFAPARLGGVRSLAPGSGARARSSRPGCPPPAMASRARAPPFWRMPGDAAPTSAPGSRSACGTRRGNWIAALGDGAGSRPAVVLATGKHDLRGQCRPWRGARPFISFKMHCGCVPIRQRRSAMPSSCFCTMAATPGCSHRNRRCQSLLHHHRKHPRRERRLDGRCCSAPKGRAHARHPPARRAPALAATGEHRARPLWLLLCRSRRRRRAVPGGRPGGGDPLLHRRRRRDRVAQRSPGGSGRARGRWCGALCGRASK